MVVPEVASMQLAPLSCTNSHQKIIQNISFKSLMRDINIPSAAENNCHKKLGLGKKMLVSDCMAKKKKKESR
jgi:hypothetical protein